VKYTFVLELYVPIDADTDVGWEGISCTGVKLLEAVDAGEVPYELVAVTENVYAVLVVNPSKIIGDEVPVIVVVTGLLVTV